MTVVEHHSAEELQALFRQEREARRAKRIWIVWQARLGQTAPQIAQQIGASRRAVQEWVRRYNVEGLPGLASRAGQGREPILSQDERRLVAERVQPGRKTAMSVRCAASIFRSSWKRNSASCCR